MKKVSLAVGSAIAAAGILALPATGAHASTSPEGHAKQVKQVRPSTTCVDHNGVQVSSGRGFLGSITFDGACVHQQLGELLHEQTGLTERVRYYTGGRLTRTVRLNGTVGSGVTTFYSQPNYNASEVCQALVANNTSTVKYGPVCEFTSG
jgi:hypothetical protein